MLARTRLIFVEEEKNRNTSKKEGNEASRVALRRLFSSYGKYDVFRSPYGRPMVLSCTKPINTNIFVSISHTRGVGLAARSLAPIGADVERIRSFSEEWGASFLVPDEKKEVDSASGTERDVRITAYWCAKEAFLKMLGVGLRIHPKKVHCAIDWKRRSVRVCGLLGISGKGRIMLKEKEGYVAALVILE